MSALQALISRIFANQGRRASRLPLAVIFRAVGAPLRVRGKALRAGPEGNEGGNQQPEQTFHEEEEKAPEAESFDPLGYRHAIHRAEPAFARKVIASFSSGLEESACRQNSNSFW